MTDTKPSYVRRFVRTGMALLIVQLFAAIATVALTGWAAFYVADLRAERDQLRVELEEVRAADPLPEQIYTEPPVEEAVNEEPDDEGNEDDMAIAPLPSVVPGPAATPRPTRRPAASRPTPPPTPPRRTQSTRPTPTPPPTRTETATPTPTAPPRGRNRIYPGGLPGQNSNAEPPFVPGRFRTPQPGGAPGAGIDPRGIAEGGSLLEPDPPRQDPPRRDPPQRDTPPSNTIPGNNDRNPATGPTSPNG